MQKNLQNFITKSKNVKNFKKCKEKSKILKIFTKKVQIKIKFLKFFFDHA